MDERPTVTESRGVSRQRDWNGVAAVIAALVGLLALCVSGYTAWLQRQQIRAQVWPYLEPAVSTSQHDVVLVNKGIGPAIVHRIRVDVDGKPQKSWEQVFETLGLGRAPPSSTVSGVVVAAGERIKQLSFATEDEFRSFMKQYSRIAMRLCYCSTLDECWTFDQREQVIGRQRSEVAACPVAAADDFADNESD